MGVSRRVQRRLIVAVVSTAVVATSVGAWAFVSQRGDVREPIPVAATQPSDSVVRQKTKPKTPAVKAKPESTQPAKAAAPKPKAKPVEKPKAKAAPKRPTVKKVPKMPDPVPAARGTNFENEVIRLTNLARAKAGCNALRLDTRIRTAARRHSADMAIKHYFAHNSLDGRTPWDRMKAAGYMYPSAENIAMGQQTPKAVYTAWMNSEGHRKNMLNCSYKAIGVGVRLTSGGPWWTEDFGFK